MCGVLIGDKIMCINLAVYRRMLMAKRAMEEEKRRDRERYEAARKRLIEQQDMDVNLDGDYENKK